MDDSCMTRVKFLKLYGQMNIKSVDDLWTICGQFMDDLWTIWGKFMDKKMVIVQCQKMRLSIKFRDGMFCSVLFI